MKTDTSLRQNQQAVKRIENGKYTVVKMKLPSVYKSDLKNHRFAIIDNQRIGDPLNWDHTWFTNYE